MAAPPRTKALVPVIEFVAYSDFSKITPHQAKAALAQAGIAEKHIQEAQILYRKKLGMLALSIRERRLWEKMGYKTWSDFMACSPADFGIGRSTLYEAMSIAESPALAKVPDEQLKRIPIASAKVLIQAERAEDGGSFASEPIAQSIVEKAATLPAKDFRNEVGGPVQRVSTIVPAEKAPALDRLLGLIRNASEDAAEQLCVLLEDSELVALAPTMDDKLDILMAGARHEIEAAKAVGGDDVQTAGKTIDINFGEAGSGRVDSLDASVEASVDWGL